MAYAVRFARLYNELMAPMMLADIERYALWDPLDIYHQRAYPEEMLKLVAEAKAKVDLAKTTILTTVVAEEQDEQPLNVSRLAPPRDDADDTAAELPEYRRDSPENTQSLLSDGERPETGTSDIELPPVPASDEDVGSEPDQ